MTQMTQTNNSTTSLPSYHAQQDVLPSYTEDLTEPERAYVAHQRDAFENLDTKYPASHSDTADVESQQRRALSPQSIARRERLDREDRELDREINRDRRRDKFMSWVGGLSFLFCLVLFAGGTIGSIVLDGLVDKAKPNIPPPYPDQDTRDRCHRELSPSQTLSFWIAFNAWAGAGFIDAVFIYCSAAHNKGRRVATEVALACLALLAFPGVLLVLTLNNGKCPKEFV